MYSFAKVDVLSLDVWGPNHVLQPSHQAHLIIPHFYGRGSCIHQTWKGSPQGEFGSTEDGQNIMIHPMYSFADVDVLSLVVWGPNHILQPSHQVYLIISHLYGRGSCICQTWKGSPRGEFWSTEDGQNIMIHPIHSFANMDVLSLVIWGPNHVLQPSHQGHLVIPHFSGRGSCICQPGKGRPR